MTISQMAQMNTTGGINSITNGYAASESAKLENEISKFQRMVDALTEKNEGASSPETLSSSQIISSGRLSGDYTSSFKNDNASQSEKNAKPQGFAANSATASSAKGTIDKTSKLYESALELESYFVKMMLSSMRSTVQKTSLNGNESYASKMYEDMMYDEMAVTMTKNAGFGLADQIYLSLTR